MHWETELTEEIGIKYPIIQGDLKGFTSVEVASAVSNAGGLGQLNAVSYSDEKMLKRNIKELKLKTDKPFGIHFNLSIITRKLLEMLKVAIQENVAVISITGGNPKRVLKKLKNTDIKTFVCVSTLRQAKKAEKYGANFVLIPGHNGQEKTYHQGICKNVLISKIAERLSIPVIVNSQISTGRGLMAKLILGAEGIAISQKFIATKDCIESYFNQRRRKILSQEQSSIVIEGDRYKPERILKNEWMNHTIHHKKTNANEKELFKVMSKETILEYKNDQENHSTLHMNLSKGKTSIPSIYDRIQTIIQEAKGIREQWLWRQRI